MSKFDLEKALKGEPVVLRNGNKAYIRHYETELDTSDPLVGYVEEGDVVYAMRWTVDGYYHWDKVEYGYDIVGMWVEPLAFEHWDVLLEDIKYLAKDSNGRWFGYIRKPSKDGEGWFTLRGDKFYSLFVLNLSIFPDCDWKESLMERPEND